jgi:hypothetical protein
LKTETRTGKRAFDIKRIFIFSKVLMETFFFGINIPSFTLQVAQESSVLYYCVIVTRVGMFEQMLLKVPDMAFSVSF